jgi:hypothetical protein
VRVQVRRSTKRNFRWPAIHWRPGQAEQVSCRLARRFDAYNTSPPGISTTSRRTCSHGHTGTIWYVMSPVCTWFPTDLGYRLMAVGSVRRGFSARNTFLLLLRRPHKMTLSYVRAVYQVVYCAMYLPTCLDIFRALQLVLKRTPYR